MTQDPGETRTLRFEIPAAAPRYWSVADGASVLDAAPFDVWVGGAATAALHAAFTAQDGADAPTAAGQAG